MEPKVKLTLSELVGEALDNAVANGYDGSSFGVLDVTRDDPATVALDLTGYDSSLEQHDVDDVAALVKSWQEKRR